MLLNQDGKGEREEENDDEDESTPKQKRFTFSPVKLKKYIDTIDFWNGDNSEKKKKVANDYYLLNKYKTKFINGKQRLVKKGNDQEVDQYFIDTDELYETIKTAHTSCGHGGEKRTKYEVKKRGICNVTATQIKLYISMCHVCCSKRSKTPQKNVPINPILSCKFAERGQVDLIDLSCFPHRDSYNYILNYQDHLTKFIMLKPLRSKTARETSNALIEIFAVIGAPKILQSDNGLEFAKNSMILKKIWRDIKIVKSRPRHPQSQGSVERANGDVMQMLRCWMCDNNTDDWVRGLQYVQLQKNCAYNRTVKMAPYKAVFGQDSQPFSSILNEEDDDDDQEETEEDDDDDQEEPEIPEEEIQEEINLTLPSLSGRVEKINVCRKRVVKNFNHSAKSYCKQSNISDNADTIPVGTPVTLNIPEVDTVKCGFSNIIGVVHSYNSVINKYRIKTEFGIIQDYFSIECIKQCPNLVVNFDNIVKFISLRTAARHSSNRFIGCKCSGKCQNATCFCKKVGKICNDMICKHKHNGVCLNKEFDKKKSKRS